jgi:hypothetical protein
MPSNLSLSKRANRFRVELFICLLLIVTALGTAGAERMHLAPRFTPGESLRYQIESHTNTTGKTTTPIANPEGGSNSNEAIHLTVRLDVLGVASGAGAIPGRVRLQATFEKSGAESQGDAVDPSLPSLADEYARAQGQSFEFTLDSTGNLSDFEASEGNHTSGTASPPALNWLSALFVDRGLPEHGVVIGQKWHSELPLTGAPILGILLHTDSTYLRNERCSPVAGPGSSGAPARSASGACAIILTRFEISHRGSSRSDATPEDYIHNGLRTSGTWMGSGEGLNSISLDSGYLVSSTQSSTQDMDYKIVSASTGSSFQRQGKMQVQTEITLLP